jgi:hypothetical protein
LGSRKLEDRIEQLRQLRTHSAAAGTDTTLRKALTDRSNLIVAEAALALGASRLPSGLKELIETWKVILEAKDLPRFSCGR